MEISPDKIPPPVAEVTTVERKDTSPKYKKNGWDRLGTFLALCSGEKILKHCPNSGTVVLLRSIWVTIVVYTSIIFLKEAISPNKIWWTFNLGEFQKIIADTIPWFGTIFAASYAALYTRFASQWAYLAGVYNQIMATQAQAPPKDESARVVFAMWKAALIEDAEEVHLATKPVYAGIIKSMLEKPEVREMYKKYTPGGETRLRNLEEKVNSVYEREHQKYQ